MNKNIRWWGVIIWILPATLVKSTCRY